VNRGSVEFRNPVAFFQGAARLLKGYSLFSLSGEALKKAKEQVTGLSRRALRHVIPTDN
jgi:hypothetical protein